MGLHQTLRHRSGPLWVAALAGLALALAGPAAPAWACSCLRVTPAEALAAADLAFSGTVTEIAQTTGTGSSGGMPVLAVTMDVSSVWKGPVAGSLVVETPTDSPACGFPFAVGETYLVYANEAGGHWSTGLCARTALLADASEDLAALGAPLAQPPDAGPTSATDPLLETDPATGTGEPVTYGLALLLLVFLGLATFLVVQRSRAGGP
jgi:hypothetical protein